MERGTKGKSKTVVNVAMAKCTTLMVISTKDNGWMTADKAQARSSMEASTVDTSANGETTCATGRAHTTAASKQSRRASGTTISSSLAQCSWRSTQDNGTTTVHMAKVPTDSQITRCIQANLCFHKNKATAYITMLMAMCMRESSGMA